MRRLAIDCETTGLYLRHGCKPFYVSTAYEENGRLRVKSWEWDVDPLTREPIIPEDERDSLQKFISTFDRYDGWNIKFDALALSTIGVRLDLKKADDWFVASHVLNSEGPHDLKGNCFYHLNILDDDQAELQKACTQARAIASRLGWAVAKPDHPHLAPLTRAPKAGWWVYEMFMPRAVALHQKRPDDHPWHHVTAKYADRDAERTYGIGRLFERMLKERGHYHLYEERLAVQELTYRMEAKPLYLRRGAARARTVALLRKAKVFGENAKRISGIENHRSGPQIAKYLYEDHKIEPPLLTEKGHPSTAKDALEKIVEDGENVPQAVVDFCKELIKYRVYNKGAEYLKQYLHAAIGDAIYSSYNVCGTATLRFSSSNPNFQNISTGKSDKFLEEWMPEIKKPSLRSAFGPPPGWFWLCCDFQKQQLIGFAYIAKDEKMIAAMKAGLDPHLVTASRIFGLKDGQAPDKGQKTIGKNCNFGFVFGASPAKIEKTAKMPGLWGLLCEMMPEAHAYMEATKKRVREQGVVYTPGGYPLVCHKEHKGVNYEVQGHEGEVVQRAMLKTDRLLTSLEPQFRRRGVEPGYVALQVHDEIGFALPDISYSYTLIPRIVDEMVAASREYGIPGSVSAEIVKESWDKSVKWEPVRTAA